MRHDGLSTAALNLIRAAREEEPRPSSLNRARLRRTILARTATVAPAALLGAEVLTMSSKAAALTALNFTAFVVGGVGIGVALSAGAELAPAWSTAGQARPPHATSVEPTRRLGAEHRLAQSPPTPMTGGTSSYNRGFDLPPLAMSPTAGPPRGLSFSFGKADAAGSLKTVEARPAPLPEHATPPAAPPSAAPSVGPDLRQELELLRAVHGAVQAGQGREALHLIQQYDARFPAGQLTSERIAAEVFAACLMGDSARARAAQARFLSRDAVSPLATRVKTAACTALPVELERNRASGEPQ